MVDENHIHTHGGSDGKVEKYQSTCSIKRINMIIPKRLDSSPKSKAYISYKVIIII
jgi:hypothetical protein